MRDGSIYRGSHKTDDVIDLRAQITMTSAHEVDSATVGGVEIRKKSGPRWSRDSVIFSDPRIVKVQFITDHLRRASELRLNGREFDARQPHYRSVGTIEL